MRLYNVSHETRYEPGADPTVAYMYPRPRRNPPSRRNPVRTVAASAEYPRRGRGGAATRLRGKAATEQRPRRYQLGYKGLDPKWFDGARATPAAPPWAALLVNGAHELYEGVAVAVDRLIAELKKK